MAMEVFQTESHYIFLKKERSLWWNRYTSEFQVKCGWDLSSVDDIECIGVTHGIVGTIALQGVLEPHLIVIKEVVPVGVLYAPHLVYKIKSIAVLGPEGADVLLLNCSKHNTNHAIKVAPVGGATSDGGHPSPKSRLFESSALVNKTWGAVKSAGSSIRNTTEKAAAIATSQVKSTVSMVVKDPVRVEKRVIDELHKIFDDTDSFYYSHNCDITNNLQRRGAPPDDRFYWNRTMLTDLLRVAPDEQPNWVLPIIQGFVQVEQCVIGNECFTLALVSRRSRNRAGTRYKRRGVDEHGNCANYVETEQVLSLRQHQISFTQVRGSVPVYWSQPGYKYRPPPRLDRDESETQLAFERHFDGELSIYQSICIINLVEQSGKEKVIGDAYANHVLKYNSDKLIYVTFDFHEYCRGMRFENVSSLIESLAPEAGAMGFHWRDNNGPICNQKGVFRVNCMDCLDRTNVVQTAIGKAVLESQLVKLGLAMPYSQLPDQLKAPFMVLWANNGDVISRQYAGTNALKGDYTRTGERKISGIMKDGMNSANRYFIQHFTDTFRQSCIDLLQGQLREVEQFAVDDVPAALAGIASTALVPSGPVPLAYYNYGQMRAEHILLEQLFDNASYYLARFKDTYRQATIDMMLGNNVSPESVSALGGSQTSATDETDALEGAEHARLLVEDCRRLLLGTTQLPVGAWGLIDADPGTGDPSETEVDTILILTDDCYIVAEYDSHLDKIVRFENVPLDSITLIELGLFQHNKMFQGPAPAHLCIRLNYAVDGVDGYFHMFRSPNIRFFNNVAVVIRKTEEITESLTAIVDLFRIALQNRGRLDVHFQCGGSLQRRKSRTLLSVPAGIPRNLSESQLVQMGSKAFSNMAGQFSKIGQTLNATKIGRGGKKADNDAPNASSKRDGRAASASGVDGVAGSSAMGAALLLRPESAYGSGHSRSERSCSDSEEADGSSIYEPELDLVEQNPLYNENVFLPSVGIVMGGTNNDADDGGAGGTNVLEERDSIAKMSSDVSTMSISSVTDNINMPVGMLECASPIRVSSPTPEIFVDGGSEGLVGGAGRQQVRNMSLNLQAPPGAGAGQSGGDNALRQLKKLTSPLSNIGKGLQTLGANLDPRKITVKSPVVPVRSASSTFDEIKQLEEKWERSNCRTKLIAL
ncbi:phosphatidylinositide phosphatase SAC2 [Anopheles ziemanni]|uniref:phosphatidylinositide phosphatase SAC2 n=1 Tax=Anopheles coustani TaxID=139045 RepID=UPI002657DB2A|nr:phosphatidylinositide phosphatase SAC2 [Anopheles coustani]XP_058176501.1 phosphatidylinositide phosphatase SAC2 [Anopheles ziemanni]